MSLKCIWFLLLLQNTANGMSGQRVQIRMEHGKGHVGLLQRPSTVVSNVAEDQKKLVLVCHAAKLTFLYFSTNKCDKDYYAIMVLMQFKMCK